MTALNGVRGAERASTSRTTAATAPVSPSCAALSRGWLRLPLIAGLLWAAGQAQAVNSSATVTSGQTLSVASSPLGGVAGCGISPGVHTYGTAAPFTTASTGRYAFEVTGGSGTVIGDPFLAVYRGSFDPANPTANLVGCNDDYNGLLSKFIATLDASTTYVAVAMPYRTGTSYTGVVNFSVGALPTISVTGGGSYPLATGTVTVAATSDSPAAITYTSSNTAVATVDASTGVVTLVAEGSTTITASQPDAASPSLYIAGSGATTVTVTVPAAVLAPAAQTLTTSAGQAMTASQALTGTHFSGAVSYAVSPALPSGLTLDTATGAISGTPAAAQASTVYTITGTGAVSGSATATVDLTVATQAQQTLTVTASPAAIRAGKTSTLSTTGGSGSGAVSYAVTSGDCTLSAAVLSAPAAAGSCVVTATKAGDGVYAAATGQVTVTVNAALAQAVDATVRGTIAAQVSHALRFTETQAGNISEHLQSLGSPRGAPRVQLAWQFTRPELQQAGQISQVMLAAAQAAPVDLVVRDTPALSPLATSLAALPPTAGPGIGLRPATAVRQAVAPAGDLLAQADGQGGGTTDGKAGALAVQDDGKAAGSGTGPWVSGSLTVGHDNLSGENVRFHTDGLTFGHDWRLSGQTVAGVALGYSNDRASIDTQGTRVRSDAVSLTLYGAFQPQPEVQFDAMLGHGLLNFRNSRWSALSGRLFETEREGHSTYMAVGVSGPIVVGALTVRPFMRLTHLSTTLKAYDEGGDVYALAFQRLRVDSNAVLGGVQLSMDLPSDHGGVWTLMARGEARRHASGSYDQTISYTDDLTETLTLSQRVADREAYAWMAGVRYLHPRGISLGLSVQGSDSRHTRTESVRAEFGWRF